MPAGASSFPPIADYGFLSDCHTTALIAPSGNVEWMCVPRMDSPSVFGAILDRDAGGFRIGPADVAVPAGRRYLPGTMVLETSWETPTGWVVVRDVLSIGPWHHEEERSPTYRRSPTDHDAEHVLVRTVKCVQGSVEIHLDCEPAFDYGGLVADWDYGAAGYHEAVTPLPASYGEADKRITRTAQHWQEWLQHGTFPDHRWRPYLQRSALTLKGLTYTPSGAMVAAATTSLPETPRGERNWDYRYSWIRDSTFMLWGLYMLGF